VTIGEGNLETRNIITMLDAPNPGQVLLVIRDGYQWKAQAIDRGLLAELTGSDIERLLVDLEESPV